MEGSEEANVLLFQGKSTCKPLKGSPHFSPSLVSMEMRNNICVFSLKEPDFNMIIYYVKKKKKEFALCFSNSQLKYLNTHTHTHNLM